MLDLFFVAREVKIISESMLIDRTRALSLICIASDAVSLVERVPSIVFGLLDNGSLVLTILLVVMQHVLFFFGNQEPILRFAMFMFGKRKLALSFSLCLNDWFLLFFFEVIERLNKFLGKEALIFAKPTALGTEGSALDVLDLKLYDLAGDGGDVDVEVGLHRVKIIII